MTGTEVFTGCWRILHDEETPHLFNPTPKLIYWLNEGVDQIVRKRPDALLSSDGITVRTITPIISASDTVSIDDRWLTALIEWIVHREFQSDDEDRRDAQQAQVHKQNFLMELANG